MSRPLMDVAEEAMRDIDQLKVALLCASVLFRTLAKEFPSDSAEYQVVQVGVSHCAEWVETAEKCHHRVLTELNEIDDEEWAALVARCGGSEAAAAAEATNLVQVPA